MKQTKRRKPYPDNPMEENGKRGMDVSHACLLGPVVALCLCPFLLCCAAAVHWEYLTYTALPGSVTAESWQLVKRAWLLLLISEGTSAAGAAAC